MLCVISQTTGRVAGDHGARSDPTILQHHLVTATWAKQRVLTWAMSLATLTALINATRVLEDLHTLRAFGGTTGGAWGYGVSRSALTSQDIDSRKWVAKRMADAGLRSVRLDGFATVYGEGGNARMPALLMGSHTDTQPKGGWLDGALGVAFALEAARVLHEGGAPGAWAVIDFQDEEGRFATLTGSRAFAGVDPPPPLEMSALHEGRVAAGLHGTPLLTHTTARDVPTAGWLGFFEAHIEQGPRLEAANASVGVVTSIVGMRQLRVTFAGRQGHAGGSPMDERADAGLAAMRYAASLDAAIRASCDDDGADVCDGAVWTFPELSGFVSHSTIPGDANLTFQFRSPSEAPLDKIHALAQAHCADDMVRAAQGLPPLSSAKPVTCTLSLARKSVKVANMDDDLQTCIAAAARSVATDSGVLTMPSRAIHDAAPVSTVMPAAMLFVPSIDGVSHSFDEHTHERDIAVGARVFVQAAAGMLLKQCAAAYGFKKVDKSQSRARQYAGRDSGDKGGSLQLLRVGAA